MCNTGFANTFVRVDMNRMQKEIENFAAIMFLLKMLIKTECATNKSSTSLEFLLHHLLCNTSLLKQKNELSKPFRNKWLGIKCMIFHYDVSKLLSFINVLNLNVKSESTTSNSFLMLLFI